MLRSLPEGESVVDKLLFPLAHVAREQAEEPRAGEREDGGGRQERARHRASRLGIGRRASTTS